MENSQSLYRRTLGEAFDSLPLVLRRFHTQSSEAIAQGSLCITYGGGWLAGIYNIVWGIWVDLFPLSAFRWIGMTPPNYPQLWQCVGSLGSTESGVYIPD